MRVGVVLQEPPAVLHAAWQTGCFGSPRQSVTRSHLCHTVSGPAYLVTYIAKSIIQCIQLLLITEYVEN